MEAQRDDFSTAKVGRTRSRAGQAQLDSGLHLGASVFSRGGRRSDPAFAFPRSHAGSRGEEAPLTGPSPLSGSRPQRVRVAFGASRGTRGASETTRYNLRILDGDRRGGAA